MEDLIVLADFLAEGEVEESEVKAQYKISLAKVEEKCRVVMDTSFYGNAFHVYLSPEHILKFICLEPGLYVYDASHTDIPKLRQAFTLLTTIDSNQSQFRNREVRKAQDALTLNRQSNHMAKDKFQRIIKDNWLHNNPITINDVQKSNFIYGPSIPSLKGRTRYQIPTRVVDATAPITLPVQVNHSLKNIALCIDFNYVNNNLVLHSISCTINYRTVSFPKNRSRTRILHELRLIFQRYNARGFHIVEIHADNEFDKV